MSTPRLFSIGLVAAIGAHAQITSNPIPEKIAKGRIAVEIRDLVRLPDTRAMRPADQDVTPQGWARVSYVRDLPDGRRFANDSRGILYLLHGSDPPTVYLNTAELFPSASTIAWRAVSSASPSIRILRGTVCFTRSTASARWAIRTRSISFRSATA